MVSKSVIRVINNNICKVSKVIDRSGKSIDLRQVQNAIQPHRLTVDHRELVDYLENLDFDPKIADFLLKNGSHTMAYSSVQRGIHHYVHENGFIPYQFHRRLGIGPRKAHVLSNPICDPNDMPEVVDGFRREQPSASLWQINENVALSLLDNLGGKVAVFGYEQWVDFKPYVDVWLERVAYALETITSAQREADLDTQVKDYIFDNGMHMEHRELKKHAMRLKKRVTQNEALIDASIADLEQLIADPLQAYYEGSDMHQVRGVLHTARNAEVRVREIDSHDLPVQAFKAVQDDWISGKMVSEREMKFFTRPQENQYEPGVRVFVAERRGELLGYCFFDPLLKDNKIIGYYADILRVRQDAPNGTSYALTLEPLRQFVQEGVSSLSLGLMPLYGIKPVFQEGESLRVGKDELNRDDYVNVSSGFVTLGLNLGYHFDFLYNSPTQAEHKLRFNGNLKPVFYWSKDPFPIGDSIDCFSVSNIHIPEQIKLAGLRIYRTFHS